MNGVAGAWPGQVVIAFAEPLAKAPAIRHALDVKHYAVFTNGVNS